MGGMSWGGIIGSALAGAGSGAAAAGVQNIQQDQLEAAQARRDQMLAQLTRENYAANKQTDINMMPQEAAAKEEAAAKYAPAAAARKADEFKAMTPAEVERAGQLEDLKPRIVPRESRLVDKTGHIILEGAERTLTPEEKDLMRARTDAEKEKGAYYKAQGEKADRAGGAGGADDKARGYDMANFKDVKDENGQSTGFQSDAKAHLLRKFITPEEAVPDKPGFFSTKKGKAAVKGGYTYYDDQTMEPLSAEEVAQIYPKQTARFPRPATEKSGSDAALPDRPPVGRSASGKIGGIVNSATPSSAASTIPAGAIAKLKANPSLRSDFNSKYGAGFADQYIGAEE